MMVSQRISSLPAASVVHPDDLIVEVDVHDTATAATGETKKITVSQLLVGQAFSVKAYGAVGDGITNDTIAIKAAAAAIQAAGGGTLVFSPGTYLVSMSSALYGVNMVTFTGLSGVQLLFLGGAKIVTADTFTYPNYGWTMFQFVACTNIEISGAHIEGVGAWPNTYRKGIVGFQFWSGCDNVRIKAIFVGLAYGVFGGDYGVQSRCGGSGWDLSIDAYDVGYPITLYETGNDSRITVNATNVHRALYLAGVHNSDVIVWVKDFSGSTGILVTANPIGGAGNVAITENCSANIRLLVRDTGSTYTPGDGVQRFLCGISTSSDTAIGYFRNLDIRFEMTQTNTSTPLMSGLLVSGAGFTAGSYNTNTTLENVTIGGVIDRSKATAGIAQYVAYIGNGYCVNTFKSRNFRIRDLIVNENSTPVSTGITWNAPGILSDVIWDGVRGIAALWIIDPPSDPALYHQIFNSDIGTLTNSHMLPMSWANRISWYPSCHILFRTSAPTTSYWTVGDTCFNSAVSSGQPEGWRCTATGTPGTWTAMSNHP